MKQTLKDQIKKYAPSCILKILYSLKPIRMSSYSQFGEDVLLRTIFNNKPTGFYVDVGSFHPKIVSNTCSFYQRGWRGINIEPNPDNAKLFSRARKKDININCLISTNIGPCDFYVFEDGALNTLSKKIAEKYINEDGCKMKSIIQVPSFPLSKILDENLPKNTNIDFLSIDVEGMDLNVLESNNWAKYVPSIILIEDLNFRFDVLKSNQINLFLEARGYALCSVLGPTLVYMQRRFKKWYNL
jgi:FkbM family methyltransferase